MRRPRSASRGGRVARAVVGDDHLGRGELLAERRDRLRDRALLVAGGDEDRGRVSHSAAASIGGTIPSSAPAFRP